MAVELGQALCGALRTVIKTNADLQTLTGLSENDLANRVHYVEAFEDPDQDTPREFFIEHSEDLVYTDWPMVQGRYVQMVHDFGKNALVLKQAIHILKTAAQDLRVTPPDDEFTACRLWVVDSGPVPTGDRQRWQQMIVFGVRMHAQRETEAVLAR